MQSYQPNQDIKLDVIFVDGAGAAVTASAGTYRVLDEDGTEIRAATDLGLTSDADTVQITVAAADNTLAAGEILRGRIVEFTLTTSFGTHVQQAFYLLKPLDPLVVGSNSFVTYAQSEFTVAQMPALAYWAGASKDDRINAMTTARDQLCEFEYRFVRDDQTQLVVDHPIISERLADLSTYTAAQLATLPEAMQKALARAQIIQADHILGGGNPVQKARDEGLMSHTVGESSSMFRPGMGPVKYPVCEAAIRVLSRYLRGPFTCDIARA